MPESLETVTNPPGNPPGTPLIFCLKDPVCPPRFTPERNQRGTRGNRVEQDENSNPWGVDVPRSCLKIIPNKNPSLFIKSKCHTHHTPTPHHTTHPPHPSKVQLEEQQTKQPLCRTPWVLFHPPHENFAANPFFFPEMSTDTNPLERNMNVILNDRSALQYFPQKLKNELTNDKTFMTSLFQNCKDRVSSFFFYTSDELKNNKDFIMSVLKPTNGEALKFASEELKNDKEIVLAAMEQWWKTLEYASTELKNDKEFMLLVMKGRPHAFGFASYALMHDHDTVMAAVTESWEVLKDVAMKRYNNDDKEVVMVAIAQNCHALEHASNSLKNDKEVVMAAVTQNGSALRYASDELKSDREVVLAAVANNGLALEYAELKDEDIVKAAKEEIANYKGGQTRKRKRTPTEQVEHEK